MRRLILGLLLVFVGLPVLFSLAAISRPHVTIRTGAEATVASRELTMPSSRHDQRAHVSSGSDLAARQSASEPYVMSHEVPDLRPMVEAMNPGQPLIEAARNGRDGAVDQLLQGNVDPNGHDHVNRTALHYAAQGGHAYIAEKLVQNGANLFAVDNQGRTPLHLAAMQGHSDMVKTLLRLGANPEIRDSAGLRPVDCALRSGHQQTAANFTVQPEAPVMITTVLPAASWAIVSIRLLMLLMLPLGLLMALLVVFRRRHRPVPLRPDNDRLQQMARLAERMEARIANLETILMAQAPRGQAVGKEG